VKRSNRVHTVVTVEEFVPDLFGDRHGRKLLANEAETVDRHESKKG
jgi:hypothetical protein